MRIISGRWRGRRLARVPAGVRPTSDRLRETLFDILAEEVEGAVWLDGFAGTGAVGLEALSRGARRVYFGEDNPAAIRALEANLKLCRADSGFEIFRQDVFKLLRDFSGEAADVLFLDPPYGFDRYRQLLSRLDDSAFAGPNSLTVLEVFKKTEIDFVPAAMTLVRRVKSGDNVLLFLRRNRPDEPATPDGGGTSNS